MSEQRDNSGVIFKNNYKEKDNQPDYKGTAIVDGVEKEIGCWVKIDKNGNSFFSVKFSEPYEKDETKKKAVKEEVKGDLPF